MKGFIPLMPNLIKDKNIGLQLATLKALGTFTNLAAITPLRLQNFYKEIIETGMINEVCSILKNV